MQEISEFGNVLLFIIASIVFILGGVVTYSILSPNRPNEEKLTTYECGEEPQGNAWTNYNVQFYIIALIFLLFDVEIVFLFPWATIFGDAQRIQRTDGLWGWFSLIEVFIFVGILILGLAYAWAKGYLEWAIPQTKTPTFEGKVPEDLYQKINEKYSK
ncbi:MAG: NADH-quinone oxidoreductase subunit A [Cytophagales bacterium]|nr:NADH-quinone oxidoreductase subunit A [Cytophagales bacterium]